jgi:ATP-dependent Clp protease ATP-binding subunit ClpC
MRLLRLDGSPGGKPNAADGGNGTFRRVYAVSGYGAHRFLAPESGLHVRERPSSRPRQFERDTVHVQVAAQPEGPSPGDEQQLARAAERALGEGGDNLSIVRRYREGPAPLVRDSANDRRSGRLDFVLQGNFDLL